MAYGLRLNSADTTDSCFEVVGLYLQGLAMTSLKLDEKDSVVPRRINHEELLAYIPFIQPWEGGAPFCVRWRCVLATAILTVIAA